MVNENNQRLYMLVAKQLSDYIKEKKIKQGQRLPTERELAVMFNVSRASIREALIALEISGWVEIKQGVGIIVTNTSPTEKASAELPDDISPFEILEARLLLEPKIAELATSKVTPEDIERLTSLLKLMEGALLLSSKELQDQLSFESDRLFHNHLAQMADNRLLTHMLEMLWSEEEKNTLWSKLNQLTRSLSKMQYWIDDHWALLEAIKARDAQKANQAMKAHIQRVEDVMSTIEFTASQNS